MFTSNRKLPKGCTNLASDSRQTLISRKYQEKPSWDVGADSETIILIHSETIILIHSFVFING